MVSVSLCAREMIQMDMEIWESSGQWGFSCYSNFKTSLSGLRSVHLTTPLIYLFLLMLLVLNNTPVQPFTETPDVIVFDLSCPQASPITPQKRSGLSIIPQELQEKFRVT